MKLLDQKFASLLEDTSFSSVKWRKWCNKKYLHGGKEKSKKCIITKTGTAETFIEELKEETKSLASHVFVAGWQQDMYKLISKDPPKNTVVAVLDLAENYTCQWQDEIQSAHWEMTKLPSTQHLPHTLVLTTEIIRWTRPLS